MEDILTWLLNMVKNSDLFPQIANLTPNQTNFVIRNVINLKKTFGKSMTTVMWEVIMVLPMNRKWCMKFIIKDLLLWPSMPPRISTTIPQEFSLLTLKTPYRNLTIIQTLIHGNTLIMPSLVLVGEKLNTKEKG